MGIFGFGKKKKEEKRKELCEVLKGLKIEAGKEMKTTVDGKSYTVTSKADCVIISQGRGKDEEFSKREVMDLESICDNTEYYLNEKDLNNAQLCIEEGLAIADDTKEKNIKEDSTEEENKKDDKEKINKNWKVYYLAGKISFMKDMFEGSIIFLQYALDLGCPNTFECYSNLASACSHTDDNGDALNYYLKALEENKEDADTLNNISDLLKQCGNDNLSSVFSNAVKEKEIITDKQLKETEEWINNNLY